MNRGVEEVFFSKVSGNFFLEIFEKSIDKHEIDAILNAPSFASGLMRVVWQWAEAAGRFHGRIRHNHPDTESGRIRRELSCLYGMGGTVQGIYALCLGVFFEKC